jgi:hypothetical protein
MPTTICFRPVVLGVAVAADRLAALALEVDRGRVEEHQLDVGEQVPPPREQLLLDQVLARAQLEHRGVDLGRLAGARGRLAP